MESKTVKLTNMIDEIGFDAALLMCLQKIGKFKDAECIEEALGITERQAIKLTRDLADVLTDSLLRAVHIHLLNDDAVEFPKQFVLQVKRSKVRTDDEGKPVKRLTVRTRKAFKDKMTGGTN